MKIKLRFLQVFVLLFLSGCNYESTQNLHHDMDSIILSSFFESSKNVLKNNNESTSYIFIDVLDNSISIETSSLLPKESIDNEDITLIVKPASLPRGYYIGVATNAGGGYGYYPFIYYGNQRISWIKPPSTVNISSKTELIEKIKESIESGNILEYTIINEEDSLSAISKLQMLKKEKEAELLKQKKENEVKLLKQKKINSEREKPILKAEKAEKVEKAEKTEKQDSLSLFISKISTLAVFFGAIALFLRILDWYLIKDQKEELRLHIVSILEAGVISGANLVKAPLLILTKLFDTTLGSREYSRVSIRRSVLLGATVIVACLSISGFLSNTYFGVEEIPWDSYDKSISHLVGNLTKELQDEYNIDGQLALAKKPAVKWGYMFFVLLISLFISLLSFIISLAFSRKVAGALQKTESFILIIGALLLGLTVTTILAGLCVVIIFTISTPLILFMNLFGEMLLDLSTPWKVGAVSGYFFFSWASSPIWIKAVSLASIVPSLLLIIASILSGSIYPFRTTIGKFLKNMLNRAVQADKGVVVFAATGATLLASAIFMATSIAMR